MMRFRVYKAYDPDGGTVIFTGRTVTGGNSTTTFSLYDLARWVREFRVGPKAVQTDLTVQFKTDDDIYWSADDSLPRRYAPLSTEEQELFFQVLAGK